MGTLTKRDLATRRNGRFVLAATILGSSMAFIDGTVVNVALPALQNAFRATIADVQWVVESYALVLAALLLVGGSLGDSLGRRRVYVAGVVTFAAASLWCGLAANIHMLIFARSLQGLGAALLVPGSLAIITSYFPASERGKAIGTWSGFTAITAAIGPVVGGWMIEHATWRWVFLLNLPLALAVLVLCAKVPESRDERASRTIDWPGVILVTCGLAGFTYALIEWPNRAQRGTIVLAAAALGLVACLAFVAVERTSAAPMVSFNLFRSRDFTGANLLSLLLYAALSGLMFFFPMDLIEVQHYTATQAGAAFLPFICIMFGLSRWSGGLVARFGSRGPLTFGPLIAACGIALFAVLPQGGSYWTTVFPAVTVMGFGMTVSVAPLTTTVMNAVPAAKSGLASGINNAVTRVAALFAVAVFGALLVAVFNRSLDARLHLLALTPSQWAQVNAARPLLAAAHNPDSAVQQALLLSFRQGYRAVILIAAALAGVSAVAGYMLITPKHKNASETRKP